jgi:Rieske Fe-S protein
MDHQRAGRRPFIKQIIMALIAIGTGGLFYTIARFFSPKAVTAHSDGAYSGIFNPETHRAKRKENKFIPLKKTDGNFEIDLDSLPEGESAIMMLATIPVIAVNRGNGYRIFNATCTHLGCLVKWDQPSKRFLCPCHGGIYNENGEVVAGPPPAGIREYKTIASGTIVKIVVA